LGEKIILARKISLFAKMFFGRQKYYLSEKMIFGEKPFCTKKSLIEKIWPKKSLAEKTWPKKICSRKNLAEK